MSIADLEAAIRKADPNLTVAQRTDRPPFAQVFWNGSSPDDPAGDLDQYTIHIAVTRAHDLHTHVRKVWQELRTSSRWNPQPIDEPTTGDLPPGSNPDSDATYEVATLNVRDCNYTPVT